ncbi:MAG: protein kinase [Anaerolineae bacterium]|nr:protein kinase [Anaerolineae bacterium]
MSKHRHSTAASITTGLRLNNRYRLEEQLGEGGAGVIYKATDEQLGRVVAIKLLTDKESLAGDKRQRFHSEARSVARLNHSHIITLYDYAEAEEGWPYLVMEFIPGQDLWAVDNSYSPDLMPFSESLPIIDDILNALEYSHARGVIHRDLKPENVMITVNGQVKVMDFGLARIQGQSRLTEEGLVAGTASYLAPELALGEESDHRVDLYAMGVIMYELLTGRRPFSGDDPLTVISQHIHAPVVPPQHYNPNIPDDLQTIILKLLAKRPNERYATASQVRQDLAPILIRLRGGVIELDTAAGNLPKQMLVLESSTSHQLLLDRIAQGKMVGRETELTELKRRWDLVRLGEPDVEPLVLISGEAGVGKNRLLRELRVYTSLRDGYILSGIAREQDSGTPYAIFANTLRSYVREQTASVLRRQTPDFIAAEVVKLAPQLAEKIGYIPPNPPLEPEAERVRLMEQISKFLLNMAYEQPTLLVLTDLHFADAGSLDILQTLICHASTTPLLVVGTYQDVALSYAHPLNRLIATAESNELLHRIPLRRLASEMVKQMLEALLGNSVSKQFTDSIYQATEGNPLFIEEVIKSLATDGQLILREGRWMQRDTGQLRVPGSIKSVLGGRLERVKKSTRELMQLAAVIGRSFNLNLLAEASPHNDETIQWAIEQALSYQLIEVSKIEDQPGNGAEPGINIHYQFQHALIRETLYEELRPLRRRQLHRQVARAIEKLVDTQVLQTTPAVLAHHLIAGAQDEKAVPYLRRAGEIAYQVYANTEAVEYLQQAQEILEDIAPDLTNESLESNLNEQFWLLRQIRKILNITGDRERELNALEKLLAVAEALGHKQLWVEAMSRQATYYWEVGKLNQAEEIARQALKVAQEHNDRQGEQYCLEQIARVLWTRRDADSMTYAAQALMIAQNLNDREREGRLTELVGHIYTDTLHDPQRAEIHFNRALAICRETGNRIDEAWTLWGMGGLAQFVDDYTRALQYYNQAIQISENIGASLQVGWDLYHVGDAWYNLGSYDQALDNYQQAQAIFNASNHQRGQIYVLISQGLVHIVNEQFDKAGNLLSQAVKRAEERNDLTLMLRSYQALSAYYRTLGGEENLTNAIRLSNRIIKLTSEGGHHEHELLGYYLRGASFFELRNLNEARKSSGLAIEQLERLTYLHSPQISAAEIYYEHSCILNTLGQVVTAQTYLQKAYDETLRKANLIVDSQQRRDFLDNVPINRIILSQAGQGAES